MKVDEAVAAYIGLRNKKEAMGKRHKEELAPIVDTMAKLENWLQKHLLEEGVDSMKTSEGTAFLQRATSATVKDWDNTLAFILENEDYSLLEARVNKTAVKDFIESNGEAPPGVNFTETIVTRVRK